VRYVGELDLLEPSLTVAETLRYSALLRLPPSTPAAEVNDRVQATLEELGLAHVAASQLGGASGVRGVSGGQRKRVNIAIELITEPPLLFLDEPTAGLDPVGAAAFDKLIRSLQQTLGLTVFLITHDLDTLYEICDRVAVIADRRVIAVGTIPELIATGHPWITSYFNGPRGRAALAANERNERRGALGTAGDQA
jgi:phospholipid/cholesterol/gamma-HCH transport system ATP-binding protein